MKTCFCTDPTAFDTKQEYFPVSSFVGDLIVKQLSLTDSPTNVLLFLSSILSFLLHSMHCTLGDSCKTLKLQWIVISSSPVVTLKSSKQGSSVIYQNKLNYILLIFNVLLSSIIIYFLPPSTHR